MTERYLAWAARLAKIDASGRTRRLRPIVPVGPTTAQLRGREIIIACSNDYLGLSWHPDVLKAVPGGGVGGSRLISGDRRTHHLLEEALEEWLGRPALLFPSGYQANLAVFSTVCERGDCIASDQLNHASIIDGIRLSRADRVIVPHAAPALIPDDVTLIAVEGLFSMDGDVPPLGDYPRDPWLAVDEAHALGCLGPHGRGAAAAQGVEPDILIGTFGKAFGAAGAFVAGPPELKELLINAGRSFIFTTGSPEPVAAMALAGLRAADEERRQRLHDRVTRMRTGLRQLGWRALGSAHIVPLVIGPTVMQEAQRLLDGGVLAVGIRWPTVSRGAERIRMTVSAEHTTDQIDRILDVLGPAP